MKVFLTGGTGYLGQRLASALAGAGHKLTALARNPEKARPLEALGAEIVYGDVTDFERAKFEPSAFDACVHSAALVRTKAADPSEFDRVNVQGIANVSKRFLEAGVARFLYTSSFMALGPSPDGKPLDESAINDPGSVHNDYERTKYLGILEFERWVDRGLPGVALFPCVIYGPGALTSGNLVARSIADLLRGRLPGVLGKGDTVWTYSYVEDVVEGHLAALSADAPARRYILGGESLTMQGFVELAAQIAGVKAPRRHIPFWVGKVAAVVEEAKAALLSREPAVTRQVIEIYRHHWVYSSGRAVKELGYRITPLKTGLAQTISWVKMQLEQGRMK